MCGIIGYTGTKNAKDVIISGLKNLEYRGYDSAGIAVSENNDIKIYKSKGKIVNLEEKVSNENITSNTGIGHTRWATHGIPNETNAHPHRHGSVTLVHNGIIENYIELKEFLIKENVQFYSETDTEVACAYINYVYTQEKDKLATVIKACSDFRGSYAFGIIFDDEPDIIYSARIDSPLVIGIGENENFITSDISAILDYTNQYVLLKHKEYAKITKDKVYIYDENKKEIEYITNTANWSATEYKKDGYDHYMLKEINEQPKVVTNVFKRYFETLENEFKNIDFSKYTNIDIVACGSAMHAGLVGKYLIENYANIPVQVEIASEYRYKKHIFSPTTLLIVVSQSGETADTLAALRLAKENNVFVIGIVNAIGSTISREVDCCIYTYAGPEIAVATTKGYTTQVSTFATLALEIAKQKNIPNIDNVISNIKTNYLSYTSLLTEIINRKDDYLNIANIIFESNNLFFIGRGIDYSIIMEGSLKLKEISYIHSESYAAGELKHGTISLIENNTPVIAIATDENLIEKTISNIKEVKARGAYTIFITNNKFKNINSKDFANITLYLPDADEIISPLLTTTALQLIAYETAKLKGCDIDKPKNLAKSVTVE